MLTQGRVGPQSESPRRGVVAIARCRRMPCETTIFPVNRYRCSRDQQRLKSLLALDTPRHWLSLFFE